MAFVRETGRWVLRTDMMIVSEVGRPGQFISGGDKELNRPNMAML